MNPLYETKSVLSKLYVDAAAIVVCKHRFY